MRAHALACVRAHRCVLACMHALSMILACVSLSIRLEAATRGALLSLLVGSEPHTHLFPVSVFTALCLI